jgi:YVTN family beta-propeller protein
MAGTCFMSFLLAGSEVAPHSPGSGRAFSFAHRLSRRAARLLCGLVLCIPFAPAAAAPFAYVPNQGSGSISIIDTATDRVVREIPTGGRPCSIAAGSDVIHVSDHPSRHSDGKRQRAAR